MIRPKWLFPIKLRNPFVVGEIKPLKTPDEIKKEEEDLVAKIQAQKADEKRHKEQEQLKRAQEDIKRLWNLFQWIEKQIPNRSTKRQFRRDFINGSVGNDVMEIMIQSTLDFYKKKELALELKDKVPAPPTEGEKIEAK